jgi:hypothetical protein
VSGADGGTITSPVAAPVVVTKPVATPSTTVAPGSGIRAKDKVRQKSAAFMVPKPADAIVVAVGTSRIIPCDMQSPPSVLASLIPHSDQLVGGGATFHVLSSSTRTSETTSLSISVVTIDDDEGVEVEVGEPLLATFSNGVADVIQPRNT